MPRYAPEYSRSIARWIYNLANAARYFYSDHVVDGRESNPNDKWDTEVRCNTVWHAATTFVVAYNTRLSFAFECACFWIPSSGRGWVRRPAQVRLQSNGEETYLNRLFSTSRVVKLVSHKEIG